MIGDDDFGTDVCKSIFVLDSKAYCSKNCCYFDEKFKVTVVKIPSYFFELLFRKSRKDVCSGFLPFALRP